MPLETVSMPTFKLNLTRKELRDYSGKVLMLAGMVAGFTPTQKDDQVVALISHLFVDHFDEMCDIAGIPPDVVP